MNFGRIKRISKFDTFISSGLLILLLCIIFFSKCSSDEEIAEVEKPPIDSVKVVTVNIPPSEFSDGKWSEGLITRQGIRDKKEITIESGFLTSYWKWNITAVFNYNEGYKFTDFIEAKRTDSLVHEKIASSTINLKLPIPDTLLFQPEIFTSRLYDRIFSPEEEEKIMIRDQIVKDMISTAYGDYKENFHTSLHDNLFNTARTITRKINNILRLSDYPNSVIVIEFLYDQNNETYTMTCKCDPNGNCEAIMQSAMEYN